MTHRSIQVAQCSEADGPHDEPDRRETQYTCDKCFWRQPHKLADPRRASIRRLGCRVANQRRLLKELSSERHRSRPAKVGKVGHSQRRKRDGVEHSRHGEHWLERAGGLRSMYVSGHISLPV